MSRLKQTKGFTLIELVIVLAIAALILAGVLLAVGGAQRSQRDSARKAIAGRVGTAIQNYASNNNGSVVGFACNANYCTNITDPDSNAAPTAGASPDGSATGVQYTLGALCPGATAPASNQRSYAVYYWSENAGAVQCTDNA